MRTLLVVCAGLALGFVAGSAQAAPVLPGPAVLAPACELAGALWTQARPPQTTVVKLHRRVIFRERVWFNGREGDLEKHAAFIKGHWYITLTDLMRHLGGTIVWGPSASFIEVTRKGLTVRVVADSDKVIVNGLERTLPAPAVRRGNRTWVPVKAFAELFGATVVWNRAAGRLDVTFTP